MSGDYLLPAGTAFRVRPDWTDICWFEHEFPNFQIDCLVKALIAPFITHTCNGGRFSIITFAVSIRSNGVISVALSPEATFVQIEEEETFNNYLIIRNA